jgi:predicted dinucleotide-binding enzyme
MAALPAGAGVAGRGMTVSCGELRISMATIGLIGSGNIGGTVARLAAAAGYRVVLSNSRGPQTLQELAAGIGPLASAGTAEQAADQGDIVVVAVPLRAYRDVPAAPLAGKVVIDANNYYPSRDGQIGELDAGSVTSSELLARHLPGARVVKAFNNIFFRHLLALARPAGAPDRSALLIAGDDGGALAAVTGFLDAIGYDAVVSGTLAQSWRQEPGSAAYGGVYGPFDKPDGVPVGAAALRARITGTRPGTATG